MERGWHAETSEIGPLTYVRLPDGQVVQAMVLRRIRDFDGSWWYQPNVSLWAGVETRSRAQNRLAGEPTPTQFLAPATAVTPIDGQDYSAVPTWRHPATLRRDHRPHPQRPRLGGPVPWD